MRLKSGGERPVASGERYCRRVLLFAGLLFAALFLSLTARAEQGSSAGTESATEIFK